MVSTRIHGKTVQALIDSGATKCFATPACITTVGLKGVPGDIFLELGNGEKILSRGYVPDVPVVTPGLTIKVGLTVTNLLHEVDLMLGINWLQLVNLVIDWSSGKVYLPNAVHTALLQGDWLAGHVKAMTMIVLSNEDDLKKMNESEMQKKIAILKCPRFWQISADAENSRTNFAKGHVNYNVQWGYLYQNDCEICKRKNEDVQNCKHNSRCKLYVMKTDEGVVYVKRMTVNAKLPEKGMSRSVGYDLAAVQSVVVPAHGKCLMKIGLALALPPDCYGRIAPRSGLALKRFIDVGAGVIDSNYRGEIGVMLFNFGEEDFVVNMGARIAQLIFEKIKTPKIKEFDSLEGSGRGDQGYGSMGVSANSSNIAQYIKTSRSVVESVGVQDNKEGSIKRSVEKPSQLSQKRKIISARQIQKSAKNDTPIFLAIVRAMNDHPQGTKIRGNKSSSNRAAKFAVAHGMTEGQKRKINREVGPKKNFISVADQERQVLESVLKSCREGLEKFIQEYHDLFPEKLPQGIPPSREVQHHIEIEPGNKPPYRPPYWLGPAE